MELISLIVSFAGVGISGLAYLKAKSAKDAADAVVKRHNSQEDRDRLRELLRKLFDAKDAAMRQKSGSISSHSIGRRHDTQTDFQLLNLADDALRTGLPYTISADLTNATMAAAEQLKTAIDIIEDPAANRDGWKDALSTIQTIIPRLEQYERQLRNAEAKGEQ